MILVDHIRSSIKPIYWFQRAVEFFSKRTEGESFTRRPSIQVRQAGLSVEVRERSHAGVIERLVATKPNS
jgi:hypothetical protein